MTLIRRPFAEFVPLRDAIDRIFEESFTRPKEWFGRFEMEPLPVDVIEKPTEIVVKAALPGLRPEDVEITITGSMLVIRGEYKYEEVAEGDYLYRELRRGYIERALTLPEGLLTEKGEAAYENGMLTLTIPRAEEAKPKHIRIIPKVVPEPIEATRP